MGVFAVCERLFVICKLIMPGLTGNCLFSLLAGNPGGTSHNNENDDQGGHCQPHHRLRPLPVSDRAMAMICARERGASPLSKIGKNSCAGCTGVAHYQLFVRGGGSGRKQHFWGFGLVTVVSFPHRPGLPAINSELELLIQQLNEVFLTYFLKFT